jgi:hypothetical protein
LGNFAFDLKCLIAKRELLFNFFEDFGSVVTNGYCVWDMFNFHFSPPLCNRVDVISPRAAYDFLSSLPKLLTTAAIQMRDSSSINTGRQQDTCATAAI